MSEKVVTCGASEDEILTEPLAVKVVRDPVKDVGMASVMLPFCAEMFILKGREPSAFILTVTDPFSPCTSIIARVFFPVLGLSHATSHTSALMLPFSLRSSKFLRPSPGFNAASMASGTDMSGSMTYVPFSDEFVRLMVAARSMAFSWVRADCMVEGSPLMAGR